MNSEDKPITAELFDYLRREQKKESLQEIEEKHISESLRELRTKIKQIKELRENINFDDQEEVKLQTEINSIKDMLKKLYDLRNKKIILQSYTRVKTGKKFIDSGGMFESDREFFGKLNTLLEERYENLKTFGGDF